MLRREIVMWGAAAVLIGGLGVGSAVAASPSHESSAPTTPTTQVGGDEANDEQQAADDVNEAANDVQSEAEDDQGENDNAQGDEDDQGQEQGGDHGQPTTTTENDDDDQGDDGGD
jgi:hypothetical protein